VISAFLYLRITVSLYMSDPEEDTVARSGRVAVPGAAGVVLAVCLLVTLRTS
jgi:NADH:ubiquinone oxidoreductase subunit 2 (subunit N)